MEQKRNQNKNKVTYFLYLVKFQTLPQKCLNIATTFRKKKPTIRLSFIHQSWANMLLRRINVNRFFFAATAKNHK